MIVVTTEEVTGHRIVEMKGQVFGLVVRSRGLGGNIMAGLRSLGGGEIVEYTELLEDARRHAVDRIVQNATRSERDVSNARMARTAPLARGDAPERDRRVWHGGRRGAAQELSPCCVRRSSRTASSLWRAPSPLRSPASSLAWSFTCS
ncbi:MAG: heavy metal-binding domain-containing protein [Chloroflexi bacterium]|nr:MAG: heavy metal-binding domain-containing protein [Chloroflexota bacterium]